MEHLINQEDLRNDQNNQYLISLQKKCFFDVNVTYSTILPNSTSNVTDPNVNCPRTFDGWMCWDETPAGTTAAQACPEFIAGSDSGRNVLKRCTENGTWLVHPNTSKPWTNYTTCIDVEDLNIGLERNKYVNLGTRRQYFKMV
ncbi:unnamed protein product [Parnassius apollo]|uniref:(apollo) hypothetical protein n=1 Tax=Parnassius apollo TaxID=110799 RepID=A0A8S3X7H6_PARAO|nr:unnamed protein product [Parnassius apollo]